MIVRSNKKVRILISAVEVKDDIHDLHNKNR